MPLALGSDLLETRFEPRPHTRVATVCRGSFANRGMEARPSLEQRWNIVRCPRATILHCCLALSAVMSNRGGISRRGTHKSRETYIRSERVTQSYQHRINIISQSYQHRINIISTSYQHHINIVSISYQPFAPFRMDSHRLNCTPLYMQQAPPFPIRVTGASITTGRACALIRMAAHVPSVTRPYHIYMA